MAKYTSLAEAQKAAEEAQAAVKALRGQSVERIAELVQELNMIISDLKRSGWKDDVKRAKQELEKLESFVDKNLTPDEKDRLVKEAFHATTPDKTHGYPQRDLMKYIREAINRPTMARNTMLSALSKVAVENVITTEIDSSSGEKGYSNKVYWKINKSKTKGWFKDNS